MDRGKIRNPIIFLVILPVRIYQLFLSPLIAPSCRFYPTCSQYCIESLNKFGLFKGIYFTIMRLKKCHPFGSSGYDPVKVKVLIKQISLESIKSFRKVNLYKGLPKELTSYDQDEFRDTIHYGLFYEDQLVSGLTLIKNNDDGDNDLKVYQIRGMFTVKNKCRKGYGSTLINQLSDVLKKKGIKAIWCNSRISAVDFYKKNHFYEVGNNFDIKYIGTHQKLIRYL